MRPFNKAFPALWENFHHEVAIEPYKIRTALIDSMGSYCSFCEKSIAGYEIVHHSLSKYREDIYRDDWNHLFLTCGDCDQNRKKELLSVDESDQYLWPDRDITFSLNSASPIIYNKQKVRYIVEDKDNIISEEEKDIVLINANPEAGQELYFKAQNTINLFQLNTAYHDAKTNTLRISLSDELQLIDHRLKERNIAWQFAESAVNRLTSILRFSEINMKSEILQIFHNQITRTTQAKGNWSIWMTVFWQAFKDKILLEELFIGNISTKRGHFNGTYKEKIKCD